MIERLNGIAGHVLAGAARSLTEVCRVVPGGHRADNRIEGAGAVALQSAGPLSAPRVPL